MANHRVESDNLDKFKPQSLKDTVWAFATARVQHPQLFEKLANHIVGLDSLDQFTHPRALSKTLWAFATLAFFIPKYSRRLIIK